MSYLGSKAASGTYQAIIAAMPVHDTYIELFLGSGAVMKRKPRSRKDIGVEIDPDAYAAAKSDLAMGSTTVLANMDAFDFLDKLEHDYAISPGCLGRVFIYADPPYLLSTRTGHNRYRFEFTEDDHQRLSDRLKMLATMHPGFDIAISGYPSSLYDDLYSSWRSYEFQVMTRGGVRTEKLWMSYPADSTHWHSYAGPDFTERQRIKRKAERWAAAYGVLPPGEKLAILASMLERSVDTFVPSPIDTSDYDSGDIDRPVQLSLSIGDSHHRLASIPAEMTYTDSSGVNDYGPREAEHGRE